jgi:signal peptide peptidase SppA
MNLLAYFNSQPLAFLPRELNRMRALLATADFDKLNASYEEHKLSLPQAEGGEPQRLRNGSIGETGVAIINVSGALFNVECYFDELIARYFGGTSYQSLMADIDAVTNNPLVQAVGFKFHTPGGTAFGMNETANKIAALTAKKTTIGYAYGLACSAGYGLASACGTITADANAWVGSIGVVTEWADFTGFYEKLGIAWEEVTSSNARFKRLDIRKEEDRAVLMQEIDGVENVFIKSVAKNRGVSVEIVKSDFGKGAVMAGNQAKSAGMIDAVGSWEDVLKQLQSSAKKANKLSASAQGDFNMSDKKKGLLAQIKELFSSDEAQEVFGESEETPKVEPATSLPAAGTDAEKMALLKQREGLLVEKAKSFAAAEVAANRLTPGEQSEFEAAYLQALLDDAANPLPEGKTRAGMMEAAQAKRKPHLFTGEQIAPDATHKILHGEQTEEEKLDAAVEEQADEYVAMVGGGKKALSIVKN